jgi:ubiquinone/menaquinone biosynthesis C-methylase UbiE|tara:strand:- start:751 stop:1509 length:759 start_codon:yes stop_codon:yes gene_type:complete
MKMATYNFKKVNGKQIIEWNRGRLRGLSEAKERLGDLVKECNKILKTKKKIKVLEIGCGYAKILIELKKVFGNKIETHGINLEERWRIELVKKFTLSNKLCSNKEFKDLAPKIHIADVGIKIPLKSNSFDLIFSQASFQYVHDKAKALEEINRLLTKEGKAIIELQELKSTPLIGYRELFDVFDKDKRLDTIKYLRKFKNINARKSKSNQNWHVLTIKNTGKLDLKLKLITSFDINEINKKWWGTKAIYILE